MNELEEFKQEIYNKVMDYDEGCNEGKFRFLQELGVQSPKKRIVVTIDVAGPQESVEELRNDIESFSMEELTYDYEADLVECSAELTEIPEAEVKGQYYDLGKTRSGDFVHIRRDTGMSWSYCGVIISRVVSYREYRDDRLPLCSNCHYNAPYQESPGS